MKGGDGGGGALRGPTRPPGFRSASRDGALGRGSPRPLHTAVPPSVYTRAGKGGSVIWHGVGTETGSAPRTGREVGLLSCHQYPIKYHSDPLKQGDAQNFIQFPGL